METVYLVCAAVGGTILVVQTLLLLIGLGGDDVDVHDVDVASDFDHDGDSSDAFFKVLSLKTLTAFMTFFGLAGMAARVRGWEPTPTMLVALGAGVVAVIIVAYIMAGLTKLQSKGNVDLTNAVGTEGRVYLRVPAEKSGRGKVIVQVQGRKIECKAVTGGAEIPTGSQVTVVSAPSQDTVEVQPIPQEKA